MIGAGKLRVNYAQREDYCMVDDEGNEIVVKEDVAIVPKESNVPTDQPPLEDILLQSELLLALTHQIEAMESLSSAGRFSPCTNGDLLAHLVWLEAVLKVQARRLRSFEHQVEALNQWRQTFLDKR